MGIVSFGATTVNVEATTLLKPVKGGSVYRQYNANNKDSHRYSYLLRGATNSGYLPNVMHIQNYTSKGKNHTNKGWNINTPFNSSTLTTDGGLEMSHAVFGSESYFHSVGDKAYLRVAGTASIPQYFHHTKENQQIAVMTREDGRNDRITLWKAHPVNLTSSASYDYGFGNVYGQNTWGAVAKVGGKNYGIHTTNDPYPLTAEKIDGVRGLSKYYDYGNINLLDNNYRSGINRNQVSKLAGLGIVGGRLVDSPGVNYVMDYTGFVVDIPVEELVSDPKKPHNYEFKLAKTMTTPKGHEARVFVQPLGMPTTEYRSLRVADAKTGTVGTATFKPVSPDDITYRPPSTALRGFKHTSNFVTEEFNSYTFNGRPSSGKIRNRSFSASSSKPRMVGLGANFGKKFGSGMWGEINKASANVEHVEMKHNGRGNVYVGWRAPTINKNRHVYTPAGLAYGVMPTASMTYTPDNRTNFKPVVVRHITKVGGKPEQIFKVETHVREKDVYGFTFKPLDESELKKYGSALEYTGNVRFGLDRTKPTVHIPSGGRWYSNEFLFSAENGGSNPLFVDIYYEGEYVPTDGGSDEEEEPIDYKETSYVVYHKDVNSGSTVHNPTTGVIEEGQDSKYVTYSNTSQYEYTGRVNINGTNREQNSYRVEYSPTDSHVSITFYYNRKETGTTVQFINRETGRKVASSTELEVIDSMNNQRALAKIVPGYRYTNTYYSSYSGSGTGMSELIPYEKRHFKVWYEDWYSYQHPIYKWVTKTNSEGETSSKYEFSHYETRWDYTMEYYWDWEPIKREATVTFYYDWIEPIDSTKRVQGDSSGDGIKPVDSYINAGIVTERNAQGVIEGESLHATTSAIYNKYEAPIAVVPVSTTLNFYDNNDVLLTSIESETNDNIRIYNDEYASSIKVDGKIGNSTSAGGNQPRDITLGSGNGSYVNVNISTKEIEDMEELQKEAEGISGANRQNRERDYVGRWVDSKTDISDWIPIGTGDYSSVQGRTIDGVDVKDVAKVEAEYNFTVYNRIKHNYSSRVGSDGIEYYEYTGSTLMPGYYRYNGNTRGSLVSNGNVTQEEELDVSDIVTDEYVDSEGFNIGAGQVATAQFKIATEIFKDGGSNIRGYMTDTIPVSRATNPIISVTDTDYRVVTSSGEKKVDYYEEFGYLPYHLEDEVMTQQAVPVGGRLVYINPYDYFVFPTVDRLSVMEESGNTVNGIRNNVNLFKGSGLYDSELVFDPTHSGNYMSEVDDFEAFVNSIADVTEENKVYMQNSLRSENEFNPTSLAGKGTANYKTYNQQATSNTSRYSPVGSVGSSTRYNKRLPVTYVHNVREFMLEDVVAVGKDTGYPVVSSPETIEEDYVERYTSDNGVAPSESDKLITTNKGSIYLIPLERNVKHNLNDVYYTRLFVNGIGNSQFNLIDEDEITIEKYLYGRGDNVIYSGEREEVEVDGEFTQDQKVGQNAKPETTTQINGTRTSNNKEVNDKVLDDE